MKATRPFLFDTKNLVLDRLILITALVGQAGIVVIIWLLVVCMDRMPLQSIS